MASNSVAQIQLLEAISLDASEDVLRARLDSTLRSITDGATEVEKEAKRLHTESQEHVAAANTILVVAALIGSATFASGLQPPLGYSPFFGSASLHSGAPTPLGWYPSYASVEGHSQMPYFCVFNALSFVFAFATLITGATAAQAPRTQVYNEAVVRYLRKMVRFAYILLCCSVTSFLITFSTGVLMVFPPMALYFSMYIIIYGLTALLMIVVTFCILPYLLRVMQSVTDTVSLTVTDVRRAFWLFVDIRKYGFYRYWLIFVIILVIGLFFLLIL
ncbi:hypothetical protein CY35_02G178000 [Sphagnum magellanicum]|nr:hypothetical protein CY35_02G178000 [Sphagnum magellanicum]